MNRALLACVFLVVGGIGWCQGAPQVTMLKLTITTPQRTALVGEPIYFSAQVTNEGPVTAVVKVNSGDVMGPWLYMDCCKEALVIQGPDGRIRYGAFGVLYAVLKPGETKITPNANSEGLVLSQPGRYDVRAELQSTGVSAGPTVYPNPPRYDYFWKGHAISNTCSVDILAPTGVDAAAYQAFKGNPLAHPVDLLKRFPTSTYAGYALVQSGPGGSLAWSAKWGTLTARQRDDAWYVPQMASPDQQEARRQLVLGNYTAFAQRAQVFLSLHPDFARADLLRKELANALFQLDQRDAAMQQVEALSKMKGPCADEAQALIASIQAAKPAP